MTSGAVVVRLETAVDLRTDGTDDRRVSFSARHEAVLADGRRRAGAGAATARRRAERAAAGPGAVLGGPGGAYAVGLHGEHDPVGAQHAVRLEPRRVELARVVAALGLLDRDRPLEQVEPDDVLVPGDVPRDRDRDGPRQLEALEADVHDRIAEAARDRDHPFHVLGAVERLERQAAHVAGVGLLAAGLGQLRVATSL